MSLKALIADRDEESTKMLSAFLIEKGYEVELAKTGKEAQLKVYKEKFFAIILDVELQNHTALEVFKYVRINHPSVKVILIAGSAEVLAAQNLTKEVLVKLGAADLLMKPVPIDALDRSLNGELQFELFKSIREGDQKNRVHTEEMLDIKDDEFTKVKLEYFFSGNATIFDIFIKVGDNRYLKILHKGDVFSPDQIKRYRETHKLEYLFFKTKDRALYVHYLNTLIEKSIEKSTGVQVDKKVKALKTAVEQFVEDVYMEGLRPQMIDEGQRLCKNVYNLIDKEKGLDKLVSQLKEEDYAAYSHSFLVVFFSSVICNNLDWATETTITKVAVGGMLHDIGKLRLPQMLRVIRPETMSLPQLEEYQQHPRLGIEMVEKFSLVSTEIKQIILQHHETVDGVGFPQHLAGVKIYPLAQVVGFADYMANEMVALKASPLVALKQFLNTRTNVTKYNQQVVKAFLNCFLQNKVNI